MNSAGLDDPAVARVPARESLEGDDPPVPEADDRLEHDTDLVALERALQLERELVPAADARVHGRLVVGEAMLAVSLGGVHRHIRVLQQLVGGGCGAGRRDPDARVHVRLPAAEEERPLHRLQQRPRDRLGRALVGRFEQHRELVAAESGGGVADPHRLLDAAGDLDEHLVADRVAEGVVDRLEVVEVEEQHRGGAVPNQGGLDPLAQERAIGQAGEDVVERLVPRGAP